jgi:uncharacterized protein YmfQ (DUF2313 family)
MGITVASRTQYENAIKKLFPQGDYWEEQFADPESDASLFVKAKLDELIRFRERMSKLQDEGRIETTDELIADWERVLLGEISYGKTLIDRRLLLSTAQEGNKLNRAKLQEVAEMYGLSIADVTFPYRPSFFGHSRFNTSFFCGPVGYSALLIKASQPKEDFYDLFVIRQFGTMRFGQDRLSWSPSYPNFEKAFITYIVRNKQLIKDFEQALQSRLLANQIALFSYEGE